MMPAEGEIVVFDRSWYSRAMIQPAMGYCTMRQYHYFMHRVNDWEKALVDEGVDLIKIYLSVSQEAQDLRFRLRITSDLQYWKYSATDRMAAERWNLLTYFKDRMFAVSSTDHAPWTIIDSDNKQQALVECHPLRPATVWLRGKRADSSLLCRSRHWNPPKPRTYWWTECCLLD